MVSCGDKSRCCCNSIDIKLAVRILAGLSIAGGVFSLLSLIFHHNGGDAVASGLLTALFRFIPGVLVFIGIRDTRSVFMLPFAVITGLNLLLNVLFILLLLIAAVATNSFLAKYIEEEIQRYPDFVKMIEDHGYTVHQVIATICLLFALVFAVSVAFSAWFFAIAKDAYLHIKELEYLVANAEGHYNPIYAAA